MRIESRLSRVKRQFEELLAICKPEIVSDISPSGHQRNRYRELLKSIKNQVEAIESEFKNEVLCDAAVQRDLPRGLLQYYKETIVPNLPALDFAFEILDPDLASLFSLLDGLSEPRGSAGRVRSTYEVAIERMEQLVYDNPELEESFAVGKATDILESKLLNFQPDNWLDNAGDLYPVRTSRKGAAIPIQAKARLIEVYRAYIFENWLSVLVLSRSILEYVILDTLHKFKIAPHYELTVPQETRKPKRLSHLIEELGERLPSLQRPMEEIKDLGNEYIHPKMTRISKESLFQRKENAKQCLVHLRCAVEQLYMADADDGQKSDT